MFFKLIRFTTPTQDTLIERHHWPIRIDAQQRTVDANGIPIVPAVYVPAKIFVIHQAPPGGLFGNFFSCVASVQQMEDLPEDDPEPGVPFYRVASVTQLCRTPEAAVEFWEAVQSVTQELSNNLQAAADLVVAEEVIFTPD
jgi:hypothetical protein